MVIYYAAFDRDGQIVETVSINPRSLSVCYQEARSKVLDDLGKRGNVRRITHEEYVEHRGLTETRTKS